MTVRIYRSTDASAPVLTGEVSKAVDLLYACLVTGYGAKATATLTSTGTNPADGDTVTIGSTVYTFKNTLSASYHVKIGANSDATLTNLRSAINDSGGTEGTDYGTGTVAHTRVTCGAPAGNAVVITSIFFGTQDNTLATTESSTQLSWGGSTMSGGTGKDPSGWTRPYTSTNSATFKQGGTAPNYYWQIDDNGTSAGYAARQSRMWGWLESNAYGTTSSPFSPTYGSFPTYGGSDYSEIRKSNTADATARPWIIAADDRTCYVFAQTSDNSNSTAWYPHMFGDFYSYIPNDDFKVAIIGTPYDTGGTLGSYPFNQGTGFGTYQAGPNSGCWIPRYYTGAGGPTRIGAFWPSIFFDQSWVFTSGLNSNYQNATLSNPNVDGKVYCAKTRIMESVEVGYNTGGKTLRGHLRGLWLFSGSTSYYSAHDTFSGAAGSLSGKTFELLVNYNVGATGTFFALETSDTWASSS